eukprot:g1141.t1
MTKAFMSVEEKTPLADPAARSSNDEGDLPRHSSLRFVLFACAIAVLLGYDIGVLSGAIAGIERDLTLDVVQKQLVMGSLNFIAGFGALIAGELGDRHGRRACLSGSMALYAAGTALMALGQTFGVLLAGRIVVGVGVGIGMCVVPLYVAEIVPAQRRGQLTACFEVSICLGIVLGYVSNLVFYTPDASRWRTMLMLPLPLAALCAATAGCCLPDSPRWLLSRGDEHAARAVLLLTHTAEEAASAIAGAQAILHLDARPASTPAGDPDRDSGPGPGPGPGPGAGRGGGGIAGSCCRVPGVLCGAGGDGRQRAVAVGLAVALLQQANGSEAAVYYVPTILKDAGLDDTFQQQLGALVVGLFKFVCIGPGIWLVDRAGRRALLLGSCVAVTCALAALCVCFAAAAPPTAVGASLCLFMAAFALGEGPVTWILVAELFPLRLRSRAVALAMCINRLTSGLCATTFVSLSGALTTAGAFALFTALSSFHVYFVWRYVPETRGKSLEQIEASFRGVDFKPGGVDKDSSGGGSGRSSSEDGDGGDDREHRIQAHVKSTLSCVQ